MIFDIVRFNQFALDMLSDVDGTLDNQDEQTIGEYLEKEGYSATFRDDYLIPMTACIWTTGADKCALEFPAVTLVRFMWNHHLLSTVARRPDWLTIPGGSKRYIDAVMRDFPQTHVHLSSPVKTLRNGQNGKVILCYGNGDEGIFDDVILACHGDEAMNIISTSASKSEKEIMSSFHTTLNKAYLHSDLSVRSKSRFDLSTMF
jgi:predicted NAD/FAD-binding protein